MKKNFLTFQEIIQKLQNYWLNYGCSILQPFDMEIGAGTLHPIFYLFSLKKNNFSFVYIQPSRRPLDSRFGKDLFKSQYHFQFQVVKRPFPNNIQEIYINSLVELDINFNINELKFIEDNWENTTLGSWGIGCEVKLNGIEITQFTYFQQMTGINCNPVIIEITYGLERLSMIIQNVKSLYEIIWSIDKNNNVLKYGDMFYLNEVEKSFYNIKYASKKLLFSIFNQYELEAKFLLSIKKPLIIPAYECILKIIHSFNLLESRNCLSKYERQSCIIKIQNLSKKISFIYLNSKKS